jgi:hypothetical protein
MDKRELTEAGIKLIAFFTLVKPTIMLIGIVANALLGGLQNSPGLLFSVISTLIPIVFAVVIIKKADWILDRLYKK